jgi:CheY-like chemotaxis protein
MRVTAWGALASSGAPRVSVAGRRHLVTLHSVNAGSGGWGTEASRWLESRAVGSRKTVLVVDDERSIRLLCRVNLELEGFRVLEAGTLQDARRTLEEEPVDVLLLDLHVAGDDGRELLRELRAADTDIRVALVTGSVDMTSLHDELADATLPKPFELDDLTSTVHELARAGTPH